jgi:sirohydrochlorin cobaltochelatase
MSANRRTIVLCGGHESGGGAGLRWLHGGEVDGATMRVAAPGRELEAALDDALRGGAATVVPMTLGRDPRLVSDTARTVRWATREGIGAVTLARPFGSADHLVGWLRSACRGLPVPGVAALIAAQASNPFDDAELHRIAALVRTHSGSSLMVEVGLRSSSGGIGDAIERCRRLGADKVAIVPAELRQRADATVRLLSRAMVLRIIAARTAAADRLLAAHGDDGVVASLASDHEHGFAHSHDDGSVHSHHTHGHGAHVTHEIG